jgi:hypothetical protein
MPYDSRCPMRLSPIALGVLGFLADLEYRHALRQWRDAMAGHGTTLAEPEAHGNVNQRPRLPGGR